METKQRLEATKQGYRALTHEYSEQEQWMMNRVIDDMRSGGIDYCVVTVGDKKEVWRKNNNTDNQ